MSLHAMAETVRAERRRVEAAAPAVRRKNKIDAARQWKETKRRAWDKARRVFEGAFGRQFAPSRFIYETGTRNRCQFVKVSINYEGKLWAFVEIFSDGPSYLSVRPIDAPEDDAKLLQIPGDPRNLYDRVATLVEEWGLA